MKAICPSRHLVSILALACAGIAAGLLSPAAAAGAAAFLARPGAAPGVAPTAAVGAASPKELYRAYAVQERKREPHGAADQIDTPLARIRTERAAAMMRGNPRLRPAAGSGNNPVNTVSSTVQTQDYTLPLEDVTSTGASIDPSQLSSTGAHIDPTWFPDESFIAYASNASSDGLYHLFAVPAAGIDTTNLTTLGARETQLSQMTSDTATLPGNERWPSLVTATQIAYCQSVGSNPNGPYQLIVAPVLTSGTTNLPYVDQTHATTVVASGTTIGAIYSVEHPVYVGDTIIFAATTVTANGLSPYHLFKYTLATGSSTLPPTQLTSGNADEENPSLISIQGVGSVIVFDSNASGYPAGSSTLPLQAVNTTTLRNIFAVTTSGTYPVQVTDSQTANSVEPSLGYVPASQAAGIGEGVHLFFSSDRVNGHYNLYDLAVTIPTNDTPSLVGTEPLGGTPEPVLTSDPSPGDSNTTPAPIGGFDNLEPAAPPFITYNSVLYASPRYLVNNIDDNPASNGALRYGAPTAAGGIIADSIEQQPTDTAIPGVNEFLASGTFPINSTSQFPSGSFEILSSHDADVDPPTLLRFNGDEVIHITTADVTTVDENPNDLPDVRQPGTTQAVHFFVRLSDRQTGVGKAYLQIKNPNSAYQDLAGNEHKVYTKDPLAVNPATDTYLHNPLVASEATSLYALSGPSVAGFNAPLQPIELGTLRQATPLGYVAPDRSKNLLTGYANPAMAGSTSGSYYRGGPIASFSAVSTNSATSLTIKEPGFLNFIYSERPLNVYSPNGTYNGTQDPPAGVQYNIPLDGNINYNVTGCSLDLYDGTGKYIETVTVTRVVENFSGANPTATYTVTPLNSQYAAPTGGGGTGTGTGTGTGSGTPTLYGAPDASAAGYAVIHQVGYYDAFGQEVDAEAILGGTGSTQVDASNPSNYAIPPYVPGLDDNTPFSGPLQPTDNNIPIWVPLTPLGYDDQQGGVLYEGTWITPSLQSDWYIDTVAYDNAYGHPGANDDSSYYQNWRIYDNVWGFSTRPFAVHTSPGGILLVNDYMLPQKFLSQGVTAGNTPVAYYGAESYLTDIDTNPLDSGNQQQLASLPDVGAVDASVGNTFDLTMTLLYHRPGSNFLGTGAVANAPYYPNTLGVNSYVDQEQSNIAAGTTPTFPITSTSFNGNSIVTGSAYPTNTPSPPSQQYDIWRILCRGALPASILNQYSPSVITQVADQTNSQPVKKVLSAPSCVIWSSPLAGEEFTGGGTIADTSTEALLEAFVNGGTTNNITFAGGGRLYVEGTTVGFATDANSGFYTGLLGATYSGQTGDFSPNTFTLKGSANHTDYISYDAYLNNDGNNDVSGGGVGHRSFKDTLAGSVSFIAPNWTYGPPANEPLMLAFEDPNVGNVDFRSDASLIDGGSSDVIFIDTFSNAIGAEPPAVGPLPQSTVEASELVGSKNTNRMVYTSFASPSGVDSGGAIVAYSSFGIESVSQNATPVTTHLDTAGTPDTPVYTLQDQRTDLMHNLVCFLRTGTLTGLVYTSGSGGAKVGLGGAQISAFLVAQGGVDAPNQTYTATSAADGTFKMLGLPSGKYGLSGYLPGYSFSQNNGTAVLVHGGDIGVDSIEALATQPGSLTVTVLDPTTRLGVSNVTVTAYEASNYGNANDLFYTATTDTTGTATFNNVKTGSYVVVATPPANSGYETTIYGASGTAAYTAVEVAAATQTSITLVLNTAGATVSGTVTTASGAAIAEATVTFTNASTSGTSPAAVTTASDGTYSVSGIQAGTYTATAIAPGYLPTTQTITLTTGETTTLNFVLNIIQYGNIVGEVTDADGNPVTGIAVTLVGGSVSESTTSGATFADPNNPSNTDNVEFATSSGNPIQYGTYTVTATSASGSVSTMVTLNSANATFQTLALPAVHGFPNPNSQLQMISVPYDYSATGYTLGQIFGYSNPKFAIWQPQDNAYAVTPNAPADTLRLGFGYWVRFPATENLLVAGNPADQTKSVSIPLYEGWNMIGEPFVTAGGVSVDSLTFTFGKNDPISFATATNPQYGIVGATLYTYQPGDSAYETLGAGGTLAEYKGYWIHVMQDCTLNYPNP